MGVFVQLARRDGFTPLHEAAAAGHTEVAKVLISIGAAPDVTNSVSTPQLAHFFWTLKHLTDVCSAGSHLSSADVP